VLVVDYHTPPPHSFINTEKTDKAKYDSLLEGWRKQLKDEIICARNSVEKATIELDGMRVILADMEKERDDLKMEHKVLWSKNDTLNWEIRVGLNIPQSLFLAIFAVVSDRRTEAH
jgi:hypothetical protein